VEVETAGASRGALHAAADEGHDVIVEILLGAGADPDAQGDIQGNALQAAAWKGHSKTVKILLDTGADPNNAQGEYGNALQSAAIEPRNIEIIKLLLN
jgi:ankyrin repeat protein